MKTRKKKRISVGGLSPEKHPTLEDIMAFVNGGKYERFFLSKPKIFPDGSQKDMTAKGQKVYSALINILYACANLTGEDEVEQIVSELDDITHLYL